MINVEKHVRTQVEERAAQHVSAQVSDDANRHRQQGSPPEMDLHVITEFSDWLESAFGAYSTK